MTSTLLEYLNTDFLDEGYPELLEKIRPALVGLVNNLDQLGEDASDEQRRAAFAEAFEQINQYEDEIETVERETILDAIYDIGELVGFDRESGFAEEWRGDW